MCSAGVVSNQSRADPQGGRTAAHAGGVRTRHRSDGKAIQARVRAGGLHRRAPSPGDGDADEKIKGRKITIAPRVPPRGQVIDIIEALKKSLGTAKPKAKVERQERGRKRNQGTENAIAAGNNEQKRKKAQAFAGAP
jgi:hypothetical protein